MVGVVGTTFKGKEKEGKDAQNVKTFEVYSTKPCDTITLC
jgi:hypothetical protein